tara:strand:- start:11 stop:394 length:384 start_codon:yes stop_codon:yes gene_type:complete
MKNPIKKKIRVKLQTLITNFDACIKCGDKRKEPYDWKGLEDSLKKEGLNQEKYGVIKVYKSFRKKGRYRVGDGNHRIDILKKINNFIDNEEIEVILYHRNFIILMTILSVLIKIISLGRIEIIVTKL